MPLVLSYEEASRRQACGLPPPRAGEDQMILPTNTTITMTSAATLE